MEWNYYKTFFADKRVFRYIFYIFIVPYLCFSTFILYDSYKNDDTPFAFYFISIAFWPGLLLGTFYTARMMRCEISDSGIRYAAIDKVEKRTRHMNAIQFIVIYLAIFVGSMAGIYYLRIHKRPQAPNLNKQWKQIRKIVFHSKYNCMDIVLGKRNYVPIFIRKKDFQKMEHYVRSMLDVHNKKCKIESSKK